MGFPASTYSCSRSRYRSGAGGAPSTRNGGSMIATFSNGSPACSSTITPDENAQAYRAAVAVRTASRSSHSRSTAYGVVSPESPRPRRS